MGSGLVLSSLMAGLFLRRRDTHRRLVNVSSSEPRSTGTWKPTAERLSRGPGPKPGKGKAMPSAGP